MENKKTPKKSQPLTDIKDIKTASLNPLPEIKSPYSARFLKGFEFFVLTLVMVGQWYYKKKENNFDHKSQLSTQGNRETSISDQYGIMPSLKDIFTASNLKILLLGLCFMAAIDHFKGKDKKNIKTDPNDPLTDFAKTREVLQTIIPQLKNALSKAESLQKKIEELPAIMEEPAQNLSLKLEARLKHLSARLKQCQVFYKEERVFGNLKGIQTDFNKEINTIAPLEKEVAHLNAYSNKWSVFKNEITEHNTKLSNLLDKVSAKTQKNIYKDDEEEEELLNALKNSLEDIEDIRKRYMTWLKASTLAENSKKLQKKHANDISLFNSSIKKINAAKESLRNQKQERLEAKMSLPDKINNFKTNCKTYLNEVNNDTEYNRLLKLLDSSNLSKQRLKDAQEVFISLGKSFGVLKALSDKLEPEMESSAFILLKAEIIAAKENITKEIDKAKKFLHNETDNKNRIGYRYDKKNQYQAFLSGISGSGASSSSSSSMSSSTVSVNDDNRPEVFERKKIKLSIDKKHSLYTQPSSSTSSLSSTAIGNPLSTPFWGKKANQPDEKKSRPAEFKKRIPNIFEIADMARWLRDLSTNRSKEVNAVTNYYACLAAMFFLAESTHHCFRPHQIAHQNILRLRHNLAGNLGLLSNIPPQELSNACQEFLSMITKAETCRSRNEQELLFQNPRNKLLNTLMTHDPKISMPGLPYANQLELLDDYDDENLSPDSHALIELVNCFRLSQKQLLELWDPHLITPVVYRDVVGDSKEYRHDQAFLCLEEMESIWRAALENMLDEAPSSTDGYSVPRNNTTEVGAPS